MSKKEILMIIVCLLITRWCPHPMYAQEIQVQADFSVGLPQGEFKEQLNRAGFGVGFSGGYRFKNSPVMFGLDFGYLHYGSEKKDVPFSWIFDYFVKNNYLAQ